MSRSEQQQIGAAVKELVGTLLTGQFLVSCDELPYVHPANCCLPCASQYMCHNFTINNNNHLSLFDVPTTCFGLTMAITREVSNKTVQ
jgi:hypothetical protein